MASEQDTTIIYAIGGQSGEDATQAEAADDDQGNGLRRSHSPGCRTRCKQRWQYKSTDLFEENNGPTPIGFEHIEVRAT